MVELSFFSSSCRQKIYNVGTVQTGRLIIAIIERTMFEDKKDEAHVKRKCKMLSETEFVRKNSVSVAQFLSMSEN